MIEIRLLNRELMTVAVLRDVSSLCWTQKYYEPGTFSLALSIDRLKDIRDARYVLLMGQDELGLIDQLTIDERILLRGRFLPALLMQRVVDQRTNVCGSAGEVAAELVRRLCVDNPESARNIPFLSVESPQTPGALVEAQLFGQTLHEALVAILAPLQMGYRMRFDYGGGGIRFQAFQGLDRTQNQSENAWCVFSKDFYNVVSERYTRSEDTRNYAYVVNGNEELNEDEWTLVIDQTRPGEDRREVFVLDHTKLTIDMTEQDFENAVRQSGLKKLAEYDAPDTIECQIDPQTAMPFQIGDLVSYQNARLGLSLDRRVTEIRQVFEEREQSTQIVLGKDQVNQTQKLLRTLT